MPPLPFDKSFNTDKFTSIYTGESIWQLPTMAKFLSSSWFVCMQMMFDLTPSVYSQGSYFISWFNDVTIRSFAVHFLFCYFLLLFNQFLSVQFVSVFVCFCFLPMGLCDWVGGGLLVNMKQSGKGGGEYMGETAGEEEYD